MKQRIVHGVYVIFEKLLRWCISPYLRAFLLKLLGASIGRNVRIYEIRIFNLMRGFSNLVVEDDAHIGTDTLIDLCDKVVIKRGASISPRVTILTHEDPGSHHQSPLSKIYPPKNMPVEIGAFAWIGACTTITLGVKIGDKAIIGAHSLVNSNIPARALSYGSPAKIIREGIITDDK